MTVCVSVVGRTSRHAVSLLFPVVLPGPDHRILAAMGLDRSIDRAENLGRAGSWVGASHAFHLPGHKGCLFNQNSRACPGLAQLIKRLFAAPAAPPESDAEKDFDQGSVLATCGAAFSQILARWRSRLRYQEAHPKIRTVSSLTSLSNRSRDGVQGRQS